MKESVTKFDFEAAFKALDEIDVPSSDKGIKANRPALTEIFSRKSKFDSLFEEYYDIGSTEELGQAKEDREAEVAKAKLERIEKIVDLDAKSAEDLLTTYVGKYIIQCPQCMTLFYKDKEDVVESEEDQNTVNVNEVCQHCGNESGYTLVGKVDTAEEPVEEVPAEDEMSLDLPEDSPEETNEGSFEEPTEESTDDMGDLEALDLDLDLEEPAEEEKTEESFTVHAGETLVEDVQEDKELEDKLTAHNEYIEYLRTAILDEEAALEKATNEQVKAAIQRRIDAFKEDLEEALPDAVKNGMTAVKEDSVEEISEEPVDDVAAEESETNLGEALTEGLLKEEKEEANLDVSADEFEELINEPEFKKPISDSVVRAMLNAEANENEAVEESISTYKCDDCGFEIDLDDEEFDGKCPHCGEHHGFYRLEEGVFDGIKNMLGKAKDGISNFIDTQIKSRASAAEFILNNALKDYTQVKFDDKDNLIDNPANQKFKYFVVFYFTNKYADGAELKACPAVNDINKLVKGKNPDIKQKYSEVEALAKGWSKIAGNGPATIFMANSLDDDKAEFLCQYFNGDLDKTSDLLSKNLQEVKNDLDGAKKLTKGKAGERADTKKLQASKITKGAKILIKDQEVVVTAVKDGALGKKITVGLADGKRETLSVPDAFEFIVVGGTTTEGLEAIMSDIEELHEASLEKFISDSLIETYGNVAGFRLTGSEYLDESLKVNGTVYFTSGASRKLTYAFSEAYEDDHKVKLCGLNEKLGLDKRFTLTGKIDETNKTFITESFTRNK